MNNHWLWVSSTTILILLEFGTFHCGAAPQPPEPADPNPLPSEASIECFSCTTSTDTDIQCDVNPTHVQTKTTSCLNDGWQLISYLNDGQYLWTTRLTKKVEDPAAGLSRKLTIPPKPPEGRTAGQSLNICFSYSVSGFLCTWKKGKCVSNTKYTLPGESYAERGCVSEQLDRLEVILKGGFGFDIQKGTNIANQCYITQDIQCSTSTPKQEVVWQTQMCLCDSPFCNTMLNEKLFQPDSSKRCKGKGKDSGVGKGCPIVHWSVTLLVILVHLTLC